MHKWMSLALLSAVACTNPTEPNAFTMGNVTATLGDTGSSDTSASGTEAGSGSTMPDEGSSSGEPDTSSSSSGSGGSSSSSSGGGEAECGNGVVEEGEQCDDADDDEFDDCTSVCAVPLCDDGAHNGDETDLDCGGSCQGCDICLQCLSEADCAGAMLCNGDNLCSVHAEIVVDWADNCGGITDGVTTEDLPAGTYLATAVMSAGTLWAQPFAPGAGYFYEIECTAGVELDDLATPPGDVYPTIAEAFMNIQANVQEFDFIGGDLTCYRSDTTCGDNSGTVEFNLDYICTEP